jgi:hypothetical protein
MVDAHRFPCSLDVTQRIVLREPKARASETRIRFSSTMR